MALRGEEESRTTSRPFTPSPFGSGSFHPSERTMMRTPERKKRKRDEVEFEYINQQRHRLPERTLAHSDDESSSLNGKADMDKREQKRGIMYYYPNYRYAFFNDEEDKHPDEEDDRKKREGSEGLLGRLRSDDPSDMGYD
eukprot:TRINITY_DN7978_c0_g1_i1.p1 TRINITY_DN7978_c0_g1~~TRINITY_DN7978_c0_g1_i1.p1  ORF type:complete len:140 (-),score=33.52 TRINITY_DN7978_c0_g1_i1:159-578(-)